MLTPVERHLAQGLQAQLDELQRISQARDDAEWARLKAQSAKALETLRETDPDLYALATTEIPINLKGLAKLEARYHLRNLRRG